VNPILAGVLVDVAVIAGVVALAIAHVIPGSAALGLLPYFLLRRRGGGPPAPPPAGAGLGAGDVDQRPELLAARRVAGAVSRALVVVALRVFDPLVELPPLVEVLAGLGRRVRLRLGWLRIRFGGELGHEAGRAAAPLPR